METNPEQQEVQKVEKLSKHGPRKCENPQCGKEFIPKNARAKYCSPSCNSSASLSRRAMALGVTPVQQQSMVQFPPVPTGMNGMGLYGIPPLAQMMIDMQQKEAARWEKRFNEEVVDHKATRQKLEELKEDFRENEKPGGLNGFLESNVGMEIAKALAPAMGEYALAKAKSAVGQIAGPPNELTKFFSDWMGSMDEPSQAMVMQLIGGLSKIADNEQRNYLIQSILQSWQR